MAFSAFLPSGVLGVFTGPNPETDVVLKVGDTMPGLGTVTSVGILREAINDSGQVAMVVGYSAAGTAEIAVIRADPPNAPPVASGDSVSVTAGGSVSDTLSGSDPDGEPITYDIVANGSKGTAVLDNASTGAFTYTANANASGDDTFTFTVTDNRGLESNVATITDRHRLCLRAVNVTSSVALVKGKVIKKYQHNPELHAAELIVKRDQRAQPPSRWTH